MNWENCLQYAAVSDVGMRRSNNQDSHAVVLASDMSAWKRKGHLFLVADGMGAHAAGELASKICTDSIPHHYHKFTGLSPAEALERAFHEANAEVHQRGQANVDFHNMGTTSSSLLLLPQGALVAHVGDSRIYRQRGKQLEQLTFDHSLVWELQASGQVTAGSDIAATIPKNVITRSIGPNPQITVDFEGPFPVEKGDTFLLCSDGLSGQVEDAEIGAILANLPPEEAAQVLVDLANLRGGPDNITVIIAKVIGDEMTTMVASAEPTPASAAAKPRPVHPAIWFATFLFGLMAIILFAVGQPLYAGGCLALCGLGLLSALIWRYAKSAAPASSSHPQRLGKGPYRRAPFAAGDALIRQLADIANDLRSAATESGWRVNMDSFDGYCQSAQEDASDGDFDQSLRNYSTAIRFMMQELRNQHQRRP